MQTRAKEFIICKTSCLSCRTMVWLTGYDINSLEYQSARPNQLLQIIKLFLTGIEILEIRPRFTCPATC